MKIHLSLVVFALSFLNGISISAESAAQPGMSEIVADSTVDYMHDSKAPLTNPAVSDDCFPPCRQGLICRDGDCYSLCSPPCPKGLACENGICKDTTPFLKPTKKSVYTNEIKTINKDEVTLIKENPFSSGLGQLIPGFILLGVGAAQLTSFLMFSSSDFDNEIPMALVTSIAQLSAGITLVSIGASKKKQHEQWDTQHNITSGLKIGLQYSLDY